MPYPLKDGFVHYGASFRFWQRFFEQSEDATEMRSRRAGLSSTLSIFGMISPRFHDTRQARYCAWRMRKFVQFRYELYDLSRGRKPFGEHRCCDVLHGDWIEKLYLARGS